MLLFRRGAPMPLRRFSIGHRAGMVPAAAPSPSLPILAESTTAAPPPPSPTSLGIGSEPIISRGSGSGATHGRPAPGTGGPPTGPDCVNCHLPTLPSGGTDRFSCPVCGRPVVRRTPGTPPAYAARAPENPGARRSQELLAAWITGASVACPKCKSPLHRAGPGELKCRACGEVRRVAEPGMNLPSTGTVGTLSPAPAAPVLR